MWLEFSLLFDFFYTFFFLSNISVKTEKGIQTVAQCAVSSRFSSLKCYSIVSFSYLLLMHEHLPKYFRAKVKSAIQEWFFNLIIEGSLSIPCQLLLKSSNQYHLSIDSQESTQDDGYKGVLNVDGSICLKKKNIKRTKFVIPAVSVTITLYLNGVSAHSYFKTQSKHWNTAVISLQCLSGKRKKHDFLSRLRSHYCVRVLFDKYSK